MSLSNGPFSNLLLRNPGSIALILLVSFLQWPRSSSAAEGRIDFSEEIRPLFNEHCIACHGGVKQTSGLSFIYEERTKQPARSGNIPIIPGKPDQSELIKRVTAEDPDERMPPPDHGPALKPSEIDLLARWIQGGAEWETHWSFIPPQPTPLPQVQDPSWCRQPLDYFILKKLETNGLKPSPEANPREWLRRVTFDLTGLPPTLPEIESFLNDHQPGAYERVVDRLLGSPRYGERWATLWMDLARYADSQGYEKDGLRTMWPYRDWLIRAFNQDMPYDEFTVRQLAGDLLPEASMDDLIASAFHRNTPTNVEGGTDDEEFRTVAVIDRVNTTWEVWQGLTFKCTQCHSHPYDPIEHEDYYRFLSFFNTSEDWDLRSEQPKLDIPVQRQDYDQARELDRHIEQLRSERIQDTDNLDAQTDWTYLTPSHAGSSHQTELVLKENEHGIPEILTQGTVSHDSKFELLFPLPEEMKRLEAIRIDVLPVDPEKALYAPELGFELSEVKAQILPAHEETEKAASRAKTSPEKSDSSGAKDEKGKEQTEEEKRLPGEIMLALALGDEADPISPDKDTLDPNQSGWGANPRITHPRRLVLVPEKAVELPENAILKLTIRQEAAPNDLAPLVMNRSRYAVTSQTRWTQLMEDSPFQQRESELADLEKKRAAIPTVASLPVMSEQEHDLQRGTAVFLRGNWLDKGEPVEPAIPGLFGSLETQKPPDRHDMARWLVSDSNPLTARVAVNRYWEQLFGAGLVETVGDFGSSGLPPTHPKLLDFLARRFQNQMDWSMKELLRELVLSSTYRQSATVTPELRETDPGNRLYARAPRNRLNAEMIRDNALAVSGLLADRMNGDPVMPPQPDGIWRAARSNLKWETAEGADRYRRALYTFWRRLSPYPAFILFDAPSRVVCNVRRISTNTPLQALATLNDPAFIECAVAFAQRMKEESGPGVRDWIAHGYLLATGEMPRRQDHDDLVDLYHQALKTYQEKPSQAAALAANPEEAALALVANTILNLDAVLTK